MLRDYNTKIGEIEYRTKTLPATMAIEFTEVVDELFPVISEIMGIAGDAQAVLKEAAANEIADAESLKSALKEKISEDDASSIFKKLSEVLKWRKNGNLIRFMAGEAPYSNCSGGILEYTEMKDENGNWRGINFDEDFAGCIENAFKLVFWVARQNYRYFFELLGWKEEKSQSGS